ncbi:MAG: hypothetical protein JKY65_13455 [Planctomycetes bacterium]|nr:hypothetical protein [Planctomycetota bacterium]
MNPAAATLTLIAASAVAPSLALAGGQTPTGIRGQLESLAGRKKGASETKRLQIRFAAPSWEEMEYARGLGSVLRRTRARAEGITYRGLAGGKTILRGRGVRVDLGDRARIERIRFATRGAARRFAVLHVALGSDACLVEVRGRQVGVLRGSAVASERQVLAARDALWKGLPAPSVQRPTLLLARPARETVIVHGALDWRSRGVLRQLLDRSETDVENPGAEAARAPKGEMRQDGSGRVSAWIDATRHAKRTAALSETLSRVPAPNRRGVDGSLAKETRRIERAVTRRAVTQQPVDSLEETETHEQQARTFRGRISLSLRSQPGGAWNSDLRAGERCLVVGRVGSWLELADMSGRPLGWVLYNADTCTLTGARR